MASDRYRRTRNVPLSHEYRDSAKLFRVVCKSSLFVSVLQRGKVIRSYLQISVADKRITYVEISKKCSIREAVYNNVLR